MKKLLLVPLGIMACIACQKTEVQTETPEMAASNAVEGYLVGIGFINPNPLTRHGDATLTYNGVTTNQSVVVPKNASQRIVTVTSVPDPGYIIDYWKMYNAQPQAGLSFQRVKDRQKTFNQLVEAETWFEPVFKERKTLSNMTVYVSGSGTVSQSPNPAYIDEPFTLWANPNPGYEFAYWTRDQDRYSNDPMLTETSDGTHTITYGAHFQPTEQVSGTVILNLQVMIGTLDFTNESIIQYFDPQGKSVIETLRDNLSINHRYAIKAGTEVIIHVELESKNLAPIYCLIGGPSGGIRDCSGGPGGRVSTSFYIYDGLNSDANMFIRAETSDFRGEYSY